VLAQQYLSASSQAAYMGMLGHDPGGKSVREISTDFESGYRDGFRDMYLLWLRIDLEALPEVGRMPESVVRATA
jgi:hypothetical protein